MTLIDLVQGSDSFHSKLTYWERLQSFTAKQKRMQPSLYDQDRFPQIPGLKIHCLLESIRCFDDFRCCSHDLTGHLHPKHHMSLWTLLKVGYFLEPNGNQILCQYIIESKRIKYTFFVRWKPFEENSNTEYTCDVCFQGFFVLLFLRHFIAFKEKSGQWFGGGGFRCKVPKLWKEGHWHLQHLSA